MSERREKFIPFSEIPATLLDSDELNKVPEAQLELLKQLTAIGPLRVLRRRNFYQAIEERASLLGLTLTHEQIYPLALRLNRNVTSASGGIVSSNVNKSDPTTWPEPKATVFRQIKDLFPNSAFTNPSSLRTNTEFTTQLNKRLQFLNSEERRKVLEWLSNCSTRLGAQSKLRVEVSDQHYTLSYYNESGHQEFVGNRRQQYSDVAVVTSTPRTAKENLERVIQELQDMLATANDFTRARLFRNLIRAIATTQSGNSINWMELKVEDVSLQEILRAKGMDVAIEGAPGFEKLTLLTGTPATKPLFEMYAVEVGVGQVLNQNKFRGPHLAEGLRMAMLDSKTPQTTLNHLRHIATALKTAINVEIYNEIFNGINQSLARMTTPHSISVKDGQVRLTRGGIEIPSMNAQLETGFTQNHSAEKHNLQSLLANPEKMRILRKAIESLATARSPLERMQAAVIFIQEGIERATFFQGTKSYTFKFQITSVDGNLKNVEVNFTEAGSLTSILMAKGVVSIRGKNVRVIESTTAA